MTRTETYTEIRELYNGEEVEIEMELEEEVQRPDGTVEKRYMMTDESAQKVKEKLEEEEYAPASDFS